MRNKTFYTLSHIIKLSGMEKSAEQIVTDIEKKIYMHLLTEMPVPTCALKKAKREWKVQVINKLLIDRLNDKSGAK